jgi:succinate dehydrogenase/fumarate reductase flavoprotein subunit
MRLLNTDVAIVGGGAAGCYAALNLCSQAADRAEEVSLLRVIVKRDIDDDFYRLYRF